MNNQGYSTEDINNIFVSTACDVVFDTVILNPMNHDDSESDKESIIDHGVGTTS